MTKPIIKAVIPVRAGSRRLKNKNILPFADSNLLIHKIRQLKQVINLDGIVVSSDSGEMLQMALDEGCEIHKRAFEYADDITHSFGEVIVNVVEAMKCDIVMWTPCVCPLHMPFHYNEAINQFIKDGDFDSLIAVKSFKEYLWDKNGPVNYKLGVGHVISQNLPDMFVVTNGIYMAKRKDMLKWSYFFGPKPKTIVIEKQYAIDIDDESDLIQARALWDKYGDKFNKKP